MAFSSRKLLSVHLCSFIFGVNNFFSYFHHLDKVFLANISSLQESVTVILPIISEAARWPTLCNIAIPLFSPYLRPLTSPLPCTFVISYDYSLCIVLLPFSLLSSISFSLRFSWRVDPRETIVLEEQAAQLSLTNTRDALHHDKRQNYKTVT